MDEEDDDDDYVHSVADSTSKMSVNKSDNIVVKKTAKRRKRRSYYIPANRVPRLLRRDARRDYGTMLMNILNSKDDLLISKFVQKFHTPDCVFSASFPDAVQFNERTNVHAAGKMATTNEITYAIQDYPDLIVEMKECQILRQESVKSSRIAIMSGWKGTKLFFPAKAMMKLHQTSSNVVPFPMLMFLSQMMTPNALQDGTITNVLTTAPPVIPVLIQCSLYILLTLDEFNMIQSVEVVASDSVSVPLFPIQS